MTQFNTKDARLCVILERVDVPSDDENVADEEFSETLMRVLRSSTAPHRCSACPAKGTPRSFGIMFRRWSIPQKVFLNNTTMSSPKKKAVQVSQNIVLVDYCMRPHGDLMCVFSVCSVFFNSAWFSRQWPSQVLMKVTCASFVGVTDWLMH